MMPKSRPPYPMELLHRVIGPRRPLLDRKPIAAQDGLVQRAIALDVRLPLGAARNCRRVRRELRGTFVRLHWGQPNSVEGKTYSSRSSRRTRLSRLAAAQRMEA